MALHVHVKHMVHLVLGIGTQDSDCANSADPDEMPLYVAFHLGLHCLPKYIFTDIQNERGQSGDKILKWLQSSGNLW